MPKLPCIHIYPGDWLRDTVSGCSIAAQGLWLRMMFLGHDSGQYGYLCIQEGVPSPSESIAQRCGVSLEDYTALLAELERACVPSRSSAGVLYSRRMVRDEEKRQLSAERQRNFKKRNRGKNSLLEKSPLKINKTNKVSNAAVTLQKRESNRDNEDEDENLLVVKTLESKRKANYEDVKAFCAELKLPTLDSEYLFNHWQGNGWSNGGKPIKDWKSTIRAWKSAGHLPSQKNSNQKARDPARSKNDQTCICCKAPFVPGELGSFKMGCKCNPLQWCEEHLKCENCCGCQSKKSQNLSQERSLKNQIGKV